MLIYFCVFFRLEYSMCRCWWDWFYLFLLFCSCILYIFYLVNFFTDYFDGKFQTLGWHHLYLRMIYVTHITICYTQIMFIYLCLICSDDGVLVEFCEVEGDTKTDDINDPSDWDTSLWDLWGGDSECIYLSVRTLVYSEILSLSSSWRGIRFRCFDVYTI